MNTILLAILSIVIPVQVFYFGVPMLLFVMFCFIYRNYQTNTSPEFLEGKIAIIRKLKRGKDQTQNQHQLAKVALSFEYIDKMLPLINNKESLKKFFNFYSEMEQNLIDMSDPESYTLTIGETVEKVRLDYIGHKLSEKIERKKTELLGIISSPKPGVVGASSH